MSAGWCGRNDKPRAFVKYEPKICYEQPAAARVDKSLYDDKRFRALTGENILSLIVERRTARTWEMNEGDLCRIKIIEGPQVVDLNFWCKHQPKKERFYSGKTRQLHSSHLKVYDRLWSNLPYLRPMATMVADSINYGIDSDGASLHDVIGTRCDDFTYKLITGKERRQSCHSQLVDAVRKIGLDEEDVHDVWNVFMCTGFTRETNQYFVKPTPVKKGDYIEIIADMDLICALSSCPQGAVSKPVGEDVPDEECFPIGVEVYRDTS
ncbi:uncharacterized protein C11D3.03c [Nilaparvata lugens]|uniref:uncharacterized protein C11D3.03c n=1 Tax=Nilaparvata lugens TaxID=108931 RepID=UPI00193CC53C|nr:uncharacterized protein C11D3.03c [Nilaparvata lugens]